jgi:hypothetical protein
MTKDLQGRVPTSSVNKRSTSPCTSLTLLLPRSGEEQLAFIQRVRLRPSACADNHVMIAFKIAGVGCNPAGRVRFRRDFRATTPNWMSPIYHLPPAHRSPKVHSFQMPHRAQVSQLWLQVPPLFVWSPSVQFGSNSKLLRSPPTSCFEIWMVEPHAIQHLNEVAGSQLSVTYSW